MVKDVYISSTYKDLVVYRDAIIEMFNSKGLSDEYRLLSMEGYVSENGKKALDVCLEDVRNAHIYILILAKRYGSLVDGTQVSYTEMEYNEAVKTAKSNPMYRIFVFWSKEENEKDDFAPTTGLDNPALEKFYNKALGENASFIHPFTTPDNLCKQILLTFNYNFKKPGNLSDYQEALLLIDRVDQSYNFSRQIRKQANSFHFSSVYENNPNDFIERLYDLEMGGKYKKCSIELGQFATLEETKFKDAFMAQLSTQWGKDMEPVSFSPGEKFFLSVEINSIEINSKVKMDFLFKTLSEFLPVYLAREEQPVANNRVFFIFYTYLASEASVNPVFDEFVNKLSIAISPTSSLAPINQLNDITKTDARNWLGSFVKSHTFDQDELDDLLQVGENPFRTFRMKEVNKLIKSWLKKNVFTN